jgi:hypothetical protein
MTDKAANDQLQRFDSNAMPWGELYIDQLKLGVPLKAAGLPGGRAGGARGGD